MDGKPIPSVANVGVCAFLQGEGRQHGVHEEVHPRSQDDQARADGGVGELHRRGVFPPAQPEPDQLRRGQGESPLLGQEEGN